MLALKHYPHLTTSRTGEVVSRWAANGEIGVSRWRSRKVIEGRLFFFLYKRFELKGWHGRHGLAKWS